VPKRAWPAEGEVGTHSATGGTVETPVFVGCEGWGQSCVFVFFCNRPLRNCLCRWVFGSGAIQMLQIFLALRTCWCGRTVPTPPLLAPRRATQSSKSHHFPIPPFQLLNSSQSYLALQKRFVILTLLTQMRTASVQNFSDYSVRPEYD